MLHDISNVYSLLCAFLKIGFTLLNYFEGFKCGYIGSVCIQVVFILVFVYTGKWRRIVERELL